MLLQQLGQLRVEAEELVEVDESNILVVSRLHGRGKQSDAEWFERASALDAGGLRE